MANGTTKKTPKMSDEMMDTGAGPKPVRGGKTYGVQVDNTTKSVRAISGQRAKEDAVPGKKRFMVDGKGVFAKTRAEALAKARKKSP